MQFSWLRGGNCAASRIHMVTHWDFIKKLVEGARRYETPERVASYIGTSVNSMRVRVYYKFHNCSYKQLVKRIRQNHESDEILAKQLLLEFLQKNYAVPTDFELESLLKWMAQND
jgi:hypothetical protein